MAKAYKKEHNIKCLLIAAKQRQAEAAEWFEGVDGVMGLTDKEMLSLRYYFVISRKFYENGIRFGHIPCFIDWKYPNAFMHINPGFSGLSLMEVWKQRVLDIHGDPELGGIIIPEDIDINVNAEKYCNSVLIAPAAFTNKGIPETFWKKLADKLKENGLEVYCNSGGLYYDQIIEGTKECLLSTKDLIVNSPLFKHVIAVRSGFTDLVCKTSASLTVLHLSEDPKTPLSVKYGSRDDDVRDLGRMDDIYSYVYRQEREDELIDLIIKEIR